MSMYNRRPRPGDGEDDLLNFQQQFLASGSEPSAKVIKCYKKENVDNKELKEAFTSNNLTAKDDGIIPQSFKQKLKPLHSRKWSRLNEKKDSIAVNDNGINDVEDMEAEMEKYDNHITAVLSEIVKEKSCSKKPEFPSLQLSANPQASAYPKKIHSGKSKKRSLFAQQFNKKSQSSLTDKALERTSIADQTQKQKPTKSDLYHMYSSSRLITGKGLQSSEKSSKSVVEQIHEENITKLSLMSSEDITHEQHKLEESLDAKILAFLKKRTKKEPEPKVEKCSSEEETINQDHSINGNEVFHIDEKWLHMNKVEAEKMKWMEKISESTKKKDIKLPNRFDFTGRLLSLDESERIPSHVGLHHHGSEPSLAGYTLQELILLARSQFSQQQVFAFRTLAKIINKDKRGEHFAVLSQFVTPLLLEAGFAFVLRWAFDQRSDNCIQAAVECLHALLQPGKLQESFLDLHFLSIRGCEVPSFDPSFKLEEKPSKDETDFHLASRDLVKGFVQMDLLLRIRYVLEVCQPDLSVVNNCLEILQKCCQHSTELAVRVLECPRLITFVIEHYLPLVWPSDCPETESECLWPNRNAIRLLRMLCQAGRHTTSRVIHDHPRLKTFLLKVFALFERIQNEDFQVLEVETWMLWTVCLSYGFYLDLYRELFPSFVLQMRSFAEAISKCDENFLVWMQYYLKAMSAVVTNLSSDNTRNHSALSWKKVKELYSLTQAIMCKCISLVNQTTTKNNLLLQVISVGLNVLATCIEKVQHLCDDLDSEVYSAIVSLLPGEVVKCAVELKQSVHFSTSPVIPAMPDLRLSTISSKQGEEYLIKMKKANFISSYLRCCVAMCSANRACCGKFAQLLIDWCRMDDNNEILMQESIGFCNRSVQHCIYWLVKLFVKCVIEISSLKAFVKYFHSLSLSCLSSLGVGDEEYINDLLCNIIFCFDFFSDQVDGNWNVSSSLPSIRTTYLFLSLCSAQSQIKASSSWACQNPQEILSFLLPSENGPLLPTDWPFLPIVHFYDKAIHQGEPIDSSSVNILVNTVRSCLCFLLFLEQLRMELWNKVDATGKLARLMCLYMTGSDLFRDEVIGNLMKQLFYVIAKSSQRSRINFNLPIPGIVSFYDFYMSLLDQYDGVSYGDLLFSAVVLLPATASSKSSFKLALWAEHTEALRSITLTQDELLLPKEAYLFPAEDDFQVIRAYLRALSSGHCHHQRSPFLYQLAIYHIGMYISNPNKTENHDEVIRIVNRLPDVKVQSHLINYRASNA